MNLALILNGLVTDPSKLKTDVEIQGIALDSRKVQKDFAFIAIAGVKEHGLVYLQQALVNGASVVVYDPSGSEDYKLTTQNSVFLQVEDLGLKLGCIADRFYQSPSRKLDVIGVTGTNGKTTCSQFLLQLIPECGVIGTLGWGIESRTLEETINTTPDALAVQKMLVDFIRSGVETIVMEVSSHGLQQGRVNEVCFKGAVFTNLSRDHLDYHRTMEAYLEAKLSLFRQPQLEFVVINGDDKKSDCFIAVTRSNVKRWVFCTNINYRPIVGQAPIELVVAKSINCSMNGIEFEVCWRNQKSFVQSRIIGDFNLENILAVITVLLARGVSLETAAKKVSKLIPVSGRMESFGGDNKPYVIVDYAHTPDALEKVLKGARKNCKQQLWLVFGCGGNRDKGKRSQMGAIAEKYADRIMLTNDNPRFENAQKIIDDIVKGCSLNRHEITQDREQAIVTVINSAVKNDCVVIAGKGHECFQEIKGLKQPFNDQDVVKRALLDWRAA